MKALVLALLLGLAACHEQAPKTVAPDPPTATIHAPAAVADPQPLSGLPDPGLLRVARSGGKLVPPDAFAATIPRASEVLPESVDSLSVSYVFEHEVSVRGRRDVVRVEWEAGFEGDSSELESALVGQGYVEQKRRGESVGLFPRWTGQHANGTVAELGKLLGHVSLSLWSEHAWDETTWREGLVELLAALPVSSLQPVLDIVLAQVDRVDVFRRNDAEELGIHLSLAQVDADAAQRVQKACADLGLVRTVEEDEGITEERWDSAEGVPYRSVTVLSYDELITVDLEIGLDGEWI